VATLAYLRRNLGVLVAMAVLYMGFLGAFVVARYRRTKDSFEYIK
jgi:hypothetical protein